MTRRQLAAHLRLIYSVVAAIAAATLIARFASDRAFQTLQTLVPILMAWPVAHATFAFQRRGAFLNDLRKMYPDVARSVHAALAFLDDHAASPRDRLRALEGLAVSIDLLRCTFRNVGPGSGLYPFEPVKQIHALLSSLPADPAPNQRAGATAETWRLWILGRNAIIAELDRGEPQQAVLERDLRLSGAHHPGPAAAPRSKAA